MNNLWETLAVFGRYLSSAGVLCLLALVPGPDVAVVTRFGVSSGRTAGLRAAAGVVSGLAIWGVLAVAGLAALLTASAGAYNALRLTGAAYLIGLGLMQLWRSRARHDQRSQQSTHLGRSAWRAGVVTNVLNPKVAVIYTSLLPSLAPREGATTAWLAGLAITHLTLSFLVLASYATAAERFRTVLSASRGQALIDRTAGVALIGLGLRVAAER